MHVLVIYVQILSEQVFLAVFVHFKNTFLKRTEWKKPNIDRFLKYELIVYKRSVATYFCRCIFFFWKCNSFAFETRTNHRTADNQPAFDSCVNERTEAFRCFLSFFTYDPVFSEPSGCFVFLFVIFSQRDSAHHVNVPESVTKANLLWQSEEVDGSSKHWKKIFIKKQLSTAKSPKMQRRKENMNTYERLLIRCFLRHNSAVSDSSCLHAY